MKITKKKYTQIFGITVVLLAIFRCASIDRACGNGTSLASADSVSTNATADSIESDGMEESATANVTEVKPIGRPSLFFNADGTQVKNRIYSVPHFGNTFPDQNDVQLAAAQRHGVKAVLDRKDAERRKSELVYVGNNPFFHVDRLNNSIPYLVPSASELLQDIGRAFFDSLQTKQIPLHKIIVTSVLRSKADVAKLRQHNSNATENSCHLYGTTFDVCYNRYKTVEDPQGPRRRQVRNDSLKWVLSEVLNDMRQQKRCLVKYEVKQGCFHITVN
ncbi:DUF5715 family protein [uncultured Prevotella sp.]|uniref:DUF5715 family protein n=1 Tax=uncultured Prevotella sp. TaxID=159272 RepID=UPI0026115EEE|nr:DUF5715 family protein [uncultured Prevotella sp.]